MNLVIYIQIMSIKDCFFTFHTYSAAQAISGICFQDLAFIVFISVLQNSQVNIYTKFLQCIYTYIYSAKCICVYIFQENDNWYVSQDILSCSFLKILLIKIEQNKNSNLESIY